MIAICLSFPAGRYHATPWGRHVNEGAVEWPPSPWRLLRSLVAVWKRTLPDVPEADMKPIFEALAAAPPRFVLPPASTGHTRHYMPWYKKGPTDRTLVFDAFVALDPNHASVLAIWPDAELSTAQRERLKELLTNLNFLGRAESWCEASLLSDAEAAAALEDGELMHAAPLDDASGGGVRRDVELVRTLCPDPATAFGDTHIVEIKTPTQGRDKNKTTTESRQPLYDPNWHLCMETLRLHDQKWSDPPGSRWVTYTRPRNCFEVKTVPRKPTARGGTRSAPAVRVARFALDSSVLPMVTDTLPVAEAARRALMSMYGRLTGKGNARGRSPTFAGKDEHGMPLTGHRHAYYLPTDEDGDGRLDHLTVYAAGGFGPDELRASQLLRHITRDSPHVLRTLLLDTSDATQTMSGDLAPRSPLAASAVWVSVTPYLITRHPKSRGPHRVNLGDRRARAEFFRADVVAQLRAARPDLDHLLDGLHVEPLESDHSQPVIPLGGDPTRTLRPLQFRRFRRKPSDDGGRRLAAGLRLAFSRPVRGPIVLGHSSHFGMGLFLPDPRHEHAPLRVGSRMHASG